MTNKTNYTIALECFVSMGKADKIRYDSLDVSNDEEVNAFWAGMVMTNGTVIRCIGPEEVKFRET